MPRASTSTTHQSQDHTHQVISSGASDTSCHPIAISTSNSHAIIHGDARRTGSALWKLCGFFSRKKPSSSADAPERRSPRTPTSAVPSDPDNVRTSSAHRRSGEEFERVFRFFDENGDGKISPSELRSYMRSVGEELSVADAEAVVESTDSDGDGLLGFDDFVKLVDMGGEEERARDLREAFGMYEMEGEGCITPKSLRRMLRRLGESKTTDECKAMIQRFDLNGDGVLSFDEFKLMML